MFKYSINLSWSDEDGCYIALIPELPGLSAFGDTPEEAAAEAKTAAEGFIKVYKEDDCELPKPRKLSTHSGQTRLRLPKNLHMTLSHEAKAEGVSLNSYIVHILSERHIAHKTDKKLDRIENLLMGSVFRGVQAETDRGESSLFIKKFETYDFEEKMTGRLI